MMPPDLGRVASEAVPVGPTQTLSCNGAGARWCT